MSIEKVKYDQEGGNIPEGLVQPDFTEMVDHGHIGVFDNFLRWDFCDKVVETFEFWYKKKHIKTDEDINKWGDGTTQFPQGGLGRKDHQLYMEVADAAYAMEINQAVGAAFEIYAKKYKGIIDAADPVSSWTCKIQRTDPGGGYHVWHCENGNFLYRDRVVTWMIYLNDIPYESGGATDFYHQEISFQPKKGTIVLWPAAYTHLHRGAFLTGKDSKYIATGWFSREPGNVTNRTLGELTGQLKKEDKLN